MNRIVFLDIDGVLVHPRNGEGLGVRIFSDDPRFDPEPVANLNELIAKSKARIVITSTWRLHHELRSLRSIFRRSGVATSVAIIDYTPEVDCDSFRKEWGRAPNRGDEVRAWLNEQDKSPKDYVILDDDADFREPQRSRLVQTNVHAGLTAQDVERALAILGVT